MSTDDFFRAWLGTMIDMRHPLAVLATRMLWEDIKAALARFGRTRNVRPTVRRYARGGGPRPPV